MANAQWKIVMVWSQRPELDPPCNLHSSLLFSRGQENFICDVIVGKDKYLFQSIKYQPDRYKKLRCTLCLLQLNITAGALVGELAKMEMPTHANDPEYSCQKWVNDALFKFYTRDWINHADWCKARDWQRNIKKNLGVGCHVGGWGEV